jgi:hypothetical protein
MQDITKEQWKEQVAATRCCNRRTLEEVEEGIIPEHCTNDIHNPQGWMLSMLWMLKSFIMFTVAQGGRSGQVVRLRNRQVSRTRIIS